MTCVHHDVIEGSGMEQTGTCTKCRRVRSYYPYAHERGTWRPRPKLKVDKLCADCGKVVQKATTRCMPCYRVHAAKERATRDTRARSRRGAKETT